MHIALRQFAVRGFWARLLARVAYRTTIVPRETKGHRHRFFSFYLTQKLNLRTGEKKVIEANSSEGMVLWIVPPNMFHEWVARTRDGVVRDLTPLHPPHQLAA